MSHVKMFENFQDNEEYANNNAYIANLMQEEVKPYHESYDALMPVFRKIEELRDVKQDYYVLNDNDVISDEDMIKFKESDPEGEIYNDDYDNNPKKDVVTSNDVEIKFEEIFEYLFDYGIPDMKELYDSVIDFLIFFSKLKKD